MRWGVKFEPVEVTWFTAVATLQAKKDGFGVRFGRYSQVYCCR